MGIFGQQLGPLRVVDDVVRWAGQGGQCSTVSCIAQSAKRSQYQPGWHRNIRVALRSHDRIVGGDPALVGRSVAWPTSQNLRRASRRPGEAEAAAPVGDVYDWYVRGRDLLSSGNAAAAAQILSRTVEAEPQARSAREMLARAQFDARQYPEARESFAYLVESDPADHYAHFGLGLAARKLGELADGGGASGAGCGHASRSRAATPGSCARPRAAAARR